MPVISAQSHAGLTEILKPVATQIIHYDGKRLYLLLEPDKAVNTDFGARIITSDGDTLYVGLETVIDRVVVTKIIDSVTQTLLEASGQFSVSLVLRQNQIAATDLIIGELRVGLGLSEPSLSASGNIFNSSNQKKTIKFGDFSDAQIALALGQIDLLLLPEIEIGNEFRCEYQIIGTDLFVEWYILTDLPDHDLYPAALSYCLKRSLAQNDSSETSLILKEHLETIFPQNKPFAHALFKQTSDDLAEHSCGFASPAGLPSLIKQLQREVDICGGNLQFTGNDSHAGLYLWATISTGDFSDLFYVKKLNELSAKCRELDLSWTDELESIIAQVTTSSATNEDLTRRRFEISRLFSERLWLIPLGKTELMIVVPDNLHYLMSPQQNRPAFFYLRGKQ